MRKVLFQIVILVFVLSSPVRAADVSGNWNLTMTGPQGEENCDLVISVEGKELTITGKHPFLGDWKGSGKLNGENIAMKIATTGQMVVNFNFKGVVKGKKMSGTREIEMGGSPPGGGEPPGGGAPKEGGAPGGGGMPDLPKEWSAIKN